MDMTVVMEEIPNLKQKVEDITSSSPILKLKSFFWDSIIFSIASTIFALSVSGIIVEFFKSDENSLACFSSLDNRAQYTFVNSYCRKHAPVAEYFPVALVLHAAALTVPHYLWMVLFSVQFESFFGHAAKVETLHVRDTGKYPQKNYTIVDYLQKEFGDRKIILTLYVAKLILQFLLMLISVVTNIVIFSDINVNIKFECYDDSERSQLFGNVTCAYPRKLFINVLQVADYLLLAVAMMVLGFSLCWCLLYNHSTEDKIAQFCYDSCIDAKYYYKPSKTWISWHKMKNDFKFLLASLLATDSGLRRVFKNILIDNIISQTFDSDLELLASYDNNKHPLFVNQENYQKLNKCHCKDSTSFGELMYDLCEVISKDLANDHRNTSRLAAMDIGCGYHSYMFGIARWHFQVVSIVMNFYYENKKETFKKSEYHAGMMLLRIPTNSFALPKQYKGMFSKVITDFIGLTNNDIDEEPIKFSLIVVGPLDSQRKHNTVNQIVEMHSGSNNFFIKGAVMLIIKPITVDNIDISRHFLDWNPETPKFWQRSPILDARVDWPKDKSVIDHSKDIRNGCVVNVKCGQSYCKFQLTAYTYQYDPDFNSITSITTINTEVQDDRSPNRYLKANNGVYLQEMHHS